MLYRADMHTQPIFKKGLVLCRPVAGSSEAKGGLSGQTLGIIAFVGGLALVLGVGYLFKGKIRHFLDYFIERVDEWGPWGYVAYGVLYTLLEIVALPAIPLTMTAGVLFGIVPGTILVSGAATAAATIAFLIARYAARDKARLSSCTIHMRHCVDVYVKPCLLVIVHFTSPSSSHALRNVSLVCC